ncbi:MBL fold metallo-hydrolase [Candidatus Fermentibacteria bacterium]|nr:MBL fold metallo-hydrolase [Candidatus Fermentibacteria bacterium]
MARANPPHRRSPVWGAFPMACCVWAGLSGIAWAQWPAGVAGTAAQDIAGISSSVIRLSDRVIVVECLDVNVTAIAADSGIVVIDTNHSSIIMEQVRRVIEEQFGRGDFINVIVTHGDPDHVGGIGAFPGIPLVAHRGFAAYVGHAMASRLHIDWARTSRLEAARKKYQSVDPQCKEGAALRALIASLELLAPDSAKVRASSTPALAFTDSLCLDLGDVRLELRFCGNAHTNHDILVYVPEERLLLTGDVINSPRSSGFPVNAMADVSRLVGELEGLLRRETGLETVVPGHGPPLSRADLETFCTTIAERFTRVRVDHSTAFLMSRAIEREGILAALQRYPVPAGRTTEALYWSEEEFSILGMRLVRSGMVNEGISVLQRATAALPQSALLYDCLGDAHVENGHVEGALAAYERSVDLMPENRHAQEMLRILR